MKEQKDSEKLSHIHFTIQKGLKEDWKERFREKGQNTLKAGITAAVFNYLYLPGLSTMNFDEVMDKIKLFIQSIETIDARLKDKVNRVESLDYDLPEVKSESYGELKPIILEKIKVYQPISITFLVQLINIPGEKLLAILNKMREEKLIDYTKNYEWISL